MLLFLKPFMVPPWQSPCFGTWPSSAALRPSLPITPASLSAVASLTHWPPLGCSPDSLQAVSGLLAFDFAATFFLMPKSLTNGPSKFSSGLTPPGSLLWAPGLMRHSYPQAHICGRGHFAWNSCGYFLTDGPLKDSGCPAHFHISKPSYSARHPVGEED